MPEEINRMLTDAIADYLFITEQSGVDNLKHEGVADDKIYFVGNCMIDSLVEHLEKASHVPTLQQYKLEPKNYAVMTLHRPSNVDDKSVLGNIFATLDIIQKDMPIIFPIHPRTQKMLEKFNLDKAVENMPNLILTGPLGYLPFLRLMSQARLMITDSGGIQEETTYLQVPCLTLRENTERPVTVDVGTNQLVGMASENILAGYRKAMNSSFENASIPPLWDGAASKRIVDILSTL